MAAKIGLTGGIGSGKSTVSNLFSQLGVHTIDADQIARRLSQPGTVEFARIVELFGKEIIDIKGKIIRSKLREIVFADPDKRKSLESILHPPIKKAMLAECRQNNSVYCILEIPLLIESGQYQEMDRVIAVTCQTENAIQRLQCKRNMEVESINLIRQTQTTDLMRIRHADDVIVNDATIVELEKQVRRLHRLYRAKFS